MQKYKVALTIINYNTQDLLLYCLKKIYQAKISIPFQVIVLDNASRDSDEVEEEVKDKYPLVEFLKQTHNYGYTKGLNICAKYAQAEYIFNLNTDAFVEKNMVENMVNYLEQNPSVGLIGPQLLNFDGSIQESTYNFLTPLLALYRRTPIGLLPFAQRAVDKFKMSDWDHKSMKEVDWILGAAYMFPKAVIEKINYLDEDMFLYLSDTYFSWQVWSAGYKVFYYPKVKMYHYHRKSSQNGLAFRLLLKKVYWIHIQDGIKFFLKTWGQPNPHK
ncbi:MAG: glycosyltransferase family 2 protein [Candidatus Paceibacterota bacterium]